MGNGLTRMNGSLPRLEVSIKNHLAPILRSDGFFGNGRNFRRLASDLIQVVRVQGAREGGRFAINLAIQPLAAPDTLGVAPDPARIVADLCQFRRRLSEHGPDQWWDYGASQESMDEAEAKAAAVYALIGRRLFSEQSGPECPLRSVTPEQFKTGDFDFSGFASTKVSMARTLSIMRRAAGNADHQRAFAQIGLALQLRISP